MQRLFSIGIAIVTLVTPLLPPLSAALFSNQQVEALATPPTQQVGVPVVAGQINAGGSYTRDSLVTITAYAAPAQGSSSFPAQVRWAKCAAQNACLQQPSWSEWVDIAKLNPKSFAAGVTFEWQEMLTDPRGAGQRSVCLQVKDANGILSVANTAACDGIIIDNLPPAGSLLINDGAAATDSLQLWGTIAAADGNLADGSVGVGGVEYSVSTAHIPWTAWTKVQGTTQHVFGKYPIELTQPTLLTGFIKFRDSLGNESQVFTDDILFSPATGSAAMQINSGDVFTPNSSVKINFPTLNNVKEVRVWNQGQAISQAVTMPYTTEVSWQLPGSWGEKRVYSQFVLINGQVLAPVSDSIIWAPVYGVEYAKAVAGSAEYTLDTIPASLGLGQNFKLALTVRNIGSLHWPTSGEAQQVGNKTVRVSYQWFKVDSTGARQPYIFTTGNRGELGRSLDYMWADDNLRFVVTTPTEVGKYILQLDTVHENLNGTDQVWFSSKGNPTPEYQIEIGTNLQSSRVASIPTLASQSSVWAQGVYYIVQPPRSDPNWRCGGSDCYVGIAEEYYQCASRGVPNYAPNTTDPNQLTGMCWWPIYQANLHLYNGLVLPPYYAARPWEYIQIGWTLYIPDNPWGGGGFPPPPPPPPVVPPGNFIPGEGGGTPTDPYGGLNGAYSAWPEVTFDRFVAWDGSYKTDQIKWSETRRPALPIITALNTSVDASKVTVYGVGIPKNHPMHVRVWNEFRYCWACGSGWEYFYQQGTAQHVKIVLFKNDWTYLGHVWNDRSDGRWSIDLPLGGVLNPGDQIMAEVQVEADYTFSGLHWWADTTETVNFNLRNPKYTGFPYFGSGAGRWAQIPQRPNLSPAELAFLARESVANYAVASALHQYCGAWIKDYYHFMDGGDTWPTYTNLIYNPSLNRVLRLRGDIRLAYWNKYAGTCGTLGLPTTDDLWAANSPLGTAGAYQQFAGGTIHSSSLGTFASTGKINEIHANTGGTAKYGFPKGEAYTKDGVVCQSFELNTICENSSVTDLAVSYYRFDLTLDYIYDEMYTNSRSKTVDAIQFHLKCNKQPLSSVECLLASDHWLRAVGLWTAKVCQKICEWDHKPKLTLLLGLNPDGIPGTSDDDYYFPIRGHLENEIFYDIWSNIHYGYVGRAAGFSATELQSGAAMGGPAGANDPGDVLSVQIGIDLWENKKWEITKKDLAEFILANIPRYQEIQRENPSVIVLGLVVNNR